MLFLQHRKEVAESKKRLSSAEDDTDNGECTCFLTVFVLCSAMLKLGVI